MNVIEGVVDHFAGDALVDGGRAEDLGVRHDFSQGRVRNIFVHAIQRVGELVVGIGGRRDLEDVAGVVAADAQPTAAVANRANRDHAPEEDQQDSRSA